MTKSLDFIKVNSGHTTEVKRQPFAVVTSEIPFQEQYYLKLIKRDSEVKAFYIFEELDVDTIKELSAEYWDKSYTIGYDFS